MGLYWQPGILSPLFLLLAFLSTLYPFIITLSSFVGAASAEEASESSRQSPVALSYYNLIIQEYSYKFWAAFMVATVIILIYSCLAAVWLAKTVYAPPPIEYDSYDYLAKRSAFDEYDGLDLLGPWPDPPSPRTTRRILAAVRSPPIAT